MPLPLKLVGFERYMWADDQPNHPMAYTIRLTCSGRIDPAAFSRAVDAAVERHPLLRARVKTSGLSGLTWVPSPEPKPHLDFGTLGEPLQCPRGARIDLREENGLRIWVRGGLNRVVLSFQFHHACCDGVGAYQFIEDVLCIYDHQVRGRAGAPSLRPVRGDLLRHRARFGLSWWQWLLRLPLELWGLTAGLTLLVINRRLKVASPETPVLDEDQRSTLPGIIAHTFDNTRLRQLLSAARAGGATFNDLVCRDVLLTLQGWNARHDPPSTRRAVRLMVPFNLRGVDDERMPAANVVGMGFLTRRLSRPAMQDPQRLLTSIHCTTRRLKFFRLGITFARCCAVLSRIPHPERRMARFKCCFATSAISNMGKLFCGSRLMEDDGKLTAGELTVDVIESAPPVRRSSYVSFGVHSYAGKMTLTMNYDRLHLTAATAAEILASVVSRLERTAEREAAPPAGECRRILPTRAAFEPAAGTVPGRHSSRLPAVAARSRAA